MSPSLMNRLRGDDEGSTLVVAMMVMFVALSLSLLVVKVAVTGSRQSGVDRQRSVAVNAAESGIDSAYSTIQQSGLTLPCSVTAGGGNVNAYPDAATTATTITYYDVNSNALACPIASGVTPARALISSTATTNTLANGGTRGLRKMEALVNLKAVYLDGFNKAIFSNGTLNMDNNHSILGNQGADADIYSNTDVVCGNGSNQSWQGSVYAQGSITISGGCSVAGQLWAKQNVSTGNTVGGRVVASRGNASVGNGGGITGQVIAGGTVSCSVAGKCFGGALPQDPPAQPFPILRSDAASLAGWTAQGYTVYPYATCAAFLAWLNTNDATMPGKMLVTVPDACSFAKKDYTLSNDLAIFASGGFSSSNQTNINSTTSATRVVHWIVPYGGAVVPACHTSNISIGNNFSIGSAINMMMYTPCDISVDNHSDHFGQIYGGTNVSISNNFDMQYEPVPVYGIDPASQPTLSYNVDIVYKRENRA